MTVLLMAGNKIRCTLRCQNDGEWGTSTATIPRCQDGQDQALYDLDMSLGVSNTLARVIISNTTQHTSETVTVQYIYQQNGFRYTLIMNLLLTTFEGPCQTVFHICLDRLCATVLSTFSGVGTYSYDSDTPFYFVVSSRCTQGWTYTFSLTVWSHLIPAWSFTDTSPYLLPGEIGEGQTYAIGLCQSVSWASVICTNGVVTGLSLGAYSLSGTIPRTIALLQGLTELDLSYNAIVGSIPPSVSSLMALNRLVLTNNKITGPIPIMSKLTSLLYAGLDFNQLNGSLPIFFNDLTNLEVLYLDGNAFVGEVLSTYCTSVLSRNLSVTLTRNPFLTCYQVPCWSSISQSVRNRIFGEEKTFCVPTQTPTFMPTFASASKRTESVAEYVASLWYIVLVAGLVFILFLGVLYWCFLSKNAVLKRRRRERLLQLPIHRWLLAGTSMRDQMLERMFRENIASSLQKDYDGRTALTIIFDGLSKLQLTGDIVYLLMMESLDLEHLETCSNERLVDWIKAVQCEAETVVYAVGKILEVHREKANILVNVVDSKGRCCKDIAGPACKELLLKTLYLHERYELFDRPPVHRSATSLVIFANDHGFVSNEIHRPGNSDKCKVAIKFMVYKEQFLREIETRMIGAFDSKYVIPLLCSYDGDGISDEDIKFRKDAERKGFAIFPFCIVMEAANDNLRYIIEAQYLAGNDWSEIRLMTQRLLACLAHIHERGIIHGDLKRKS